MPNGFVNFLDEFQRLPARTERLPTLMEVAGCAHKENVCSNILAFFFDPEGPHGLGTLFLDAIMRIDGTQNQEGTIGSNVSVEREVTTAAGNRIDILIQSDSHAILIENKIFAGIDNPFDEYSAYLDSLQPTGRHKHKFLLTLTPISESTERDIAAHGFRNITHGRFMNEIRGLLGRYIAPRVDTHYLPFMLDLLNTLDHLQEGMVMDPAFLDFLVSRRNDAEAFLAKIEALKTELRNKVGGLADLIDVAPCSNVSQEKYRERGRLFDILVHNITLVSGLVVAVDTVISPSGWTVEIFARNGNNAEVRNRLQRLDIPFEEGERFICGHFEYTNNLDQIHPFVRDIVCRLAQQ